MMICKSATVIVVTSVIVVREMGLGVMVSSCMSSSASKSSFGRRHQSSLEEDCSSPQTEDLVMRRSYHCLTHCSKSSLMATVSGHVERSAKWPMPQHSGRSKMRIDVSSGISGLMAVTRELVGGMLKN